MNIKKHAWLLAAIIFTATSVIASELPIKQIQIINRTQDIKSGDSFKLAIKIVLNPGWHLYGINPGQVGLPLTVNWNLPPKITLNKMDWPKAQIFNYEGIKANGYKNSVTIDCYFNTQTDLAQNIIAPMAVQVTWLACKDQCVPGHAELSTQIKTLGPSIATQNNLGSPLKNNGTRMGYLLLLMGLAFMGGLILNVMPCVLPVISIKALHLISLKNHKEAQEQGIAYTFGVLLSFWCLAALIIISKKFGYSLGWGFQMQSPAFIYALIILFFGIGLYLISPIEMGLSLTRLTVTRLNSPKFTAWFSGLLAVVAATPCTAPFMGAAIGIALSQNTVTIIIVFTALGLGMALPFLLLSFIPNWTHKLPKPGAWTQILREALSFPMLATTVWLISVLAKQINPNMTVLLLTLLGIGFIFWLWHLLQKKTSRSHWIAIVLAVIIITAGWKLLIPERTASNLFRTQISWHKYDPAAIQTELDQNHIVFIRFTADWCLTCQASNWVFNNQIAAAFASAKVTPFIADWTQKDPMISDALAKYQRAGVPLYVILATNENPIILPTLITPNDIINALNTIKKNNQRKPS